MPRDGDDAPTLTDAPAETLGGVAPPPTPSGGQARSELVGSISRYRVDQMIARGGMGEILSARDDQIGRPVAIKRLRGDAHSPELLARFLREARIQGRLEHPAVVPVHELAHDDENRPFFVMKQLAGTTLADVLARLARNEPHAVADFTRLRLLRAFTDICLAIEFAHTRGVVHRDLKPANIMLGDFGEVYVLDWGIARIAGDPSTQPVDRRSFADIQTATGGSPLDTETVAGAILGTPGYIAPEQIRGEQDLDGRADVYSLGCILFEILALEPLHPRGQAGLASALAGVDARPSLRAPGRGIPPELDAICARATTVERTERFTTARSLGDSVQRFLDGDRDMGLRRELARTELTAARAALRKGDGAIERRDAIRAAARALALDPTDREPAELVGGLMMAPPKEVPPEVDHELHELDMAELQKSARFGMLVGFAYLLFFPILYWCGFREPWYMIAGPALCIAIIVVEAVVAKRNAFLSGYIAIAGNLAMFALFSWMVSPVVIGPGPATIMVMLLAAHRTLIKPWLLALLAIAATIAPWLLEWAGVLGRTTTITGSDIVMHTAANELGPTAAKFTLVLYLVALVLLAALLARLQDDDRRRQRRTLQLQSWQFRQLVPRPQSLPPRVRAR